MAGAAGRGEERVGGETGGRRPVERARHWRYDDLPGVDLLRARYIRKTFVRHTHEHFVIAAIADGVEVFHHRERRTAAAAACPHGRSRHRGTRACGAGRTDGRPADP
jgi:hypothetical protein